MSDTHPPDGTEATAITGRQARLWRAGRTGWALLGIAALVALTGYVASLLVLVVVPVILALFPAALLAPLARWMKDRGVPAALAAVLSLLAGIVAILALVGAMIPLVAAELPELAESAGDGVQQVQQQLEDGVLGIEVGGVGELLDQAGEQLGDAGELAGQALEAAVVAFETIAALLLMFVILFFYLKDGRWLADTVPPRLRADVRESMQRAWDTLGTYFRGQLPVGLINAALIGVALLLLGTPPAIPLAVLVFFGGLFPVVGALVAGALAVLVAAAHAGLVMGLVVAGIVIAIEQLEGNVLEPLIHGHAVALHPLVILLSITAGALLLGIFGALIAVPVAASTASVLDYLRGKGQGTSRTGEPEEAAPEST